MRARQIAVVAALVTLGIAGVAVPTVADMTTQAEENGADGLGAEMTSFAQSTAADTSSSIDTGMWEAEINQSDDPEATVSDRATELEQRLERLEEKSQQLSDNDSTSPGYTARAIAIRAEIANLRSAIEDANQSANRYGVDVDKLDQLRSAAANMTGPEVRDIARNMTDAPRGPEEAPGQSDGNPGNSDDNPGQSDDNPGNSDDNPGNAGNSGGSNDTSGGSNDNAGNSDGTAGDSDPGQPDGTDDQPGSPGSGTQ